MPELDDLAAQMPAGSASAVTPPSQSPLTYQAPAYTPKDASGFAKLRAMYSKAQEALPEGYRAVVTSDERPGAHVAGGGGVSQHDPVRGAGAIDVQIYGPDGKAIPNRGEDTSGMYRKFAVSMYQAQQELYPDLSGRLAYGGNFTTGADSGERDLMHFDLGGDRGRFGTLAELAGSHAQAGGVVAAKRKLSVDELTDIASAMPSGVASESAKGPAPTLSDAVTTAAESGMGLGGVNDDGVTSALTTGMRRGAVTGPAQAALELVSPDTARKLTQFESGFDADVDKHPVIATIGDMIGSTAGVLIGGAALGATRVGGLMARAVPEVASRIGLITRGAAAGAAAGVTTYNRDPENASRSAEAIGGTLFGALGGATTRALVRGAKELADTNAWARFKELLTRNVGDLTKNTSPLRDQIVSRFDALERERTLRYGLQRAAGEASQGFEYEPLASGTKGALTDSRMAGVAPTATTKTVAASVDNELGGPAQRAARAEYNARVAEYEAQRDAWRKTYGGMSDAVRDMNVRSGRIPPPPDAPLVYEAPRVTAAQFASAKTAINRAWRRARDAATRTQLGMIRQGLQDEAERAAREAGVTTEQFLRQMSSADKFQRETYGPVRDFFGGRTAQEIKRDPGKFTVAHVYDVASKLILGGDREALQSFKKLVGGQGAGALKSIAQRVMFDEVERGTTTFPRFVAQHRENLTELLGRDGVQELQGMAQIAERLNTPQGFSFLNRILRHEHGVAQSLGMMRVAEGVYEGQAHRVREGVSLISAPFVLHAAALALNKLSHVPSALPLIKHIGTLKPGSAAMDKAIAALERRAIAASAVGSREMSPAVGQTGAALGLP